MGFRKIDWPVCIKRLVANTKGRGIPIGQTGLPGYGAYDAISGRQYVRYDKVDFISCFVIP